MKSSHGRGPGNRNEGGSQRPGGGPPQRGRPGGGPHSGGPHSGGPHAGGPKEGGRGGGRGGARPPQGERPAAAAPAREENRLHLPSRPQPQANTPRPPSRPDPRPDHRPDHRQGGPQRPNPNDTPRGTVWLYGVHAVAAALANPARRLRRLLLTEDAEAAVLTRVKQPWPIQAERVDRPRLDQLLGRDTVHQGMALLADLLVPPSLAQALEREGPVLVLDQVTDPRNVGAIMRAAAAFGVAAVIVQDRNAPEETGALAKAASGALEKVPLFRAVNIARTIVALKAAGLWCIGLDASGAPLSAVAIGNRRVALVLGAEGEGMRRLTRDTCDETAGLAMPKGHESEMESLNVSAAAAIALYEVRRPL